MPGQVRSAASTTLAAWVLFCFTVAQVRPTVNDSRFDEAAYVHPLIAGARWLGLAALVGSLVVVVGTVLPLAAAAARQAWRRRDSVAFALFAAPPAGFVIFVGYSLLLWQVPDQPENTWLTAAMSVSWLVLGLILAEVAGVGAAIALLRRTQLRPPLLRLTGWATTATAAAMVLGLLAGAMYGLAIWIETPSLFFSAHGFLTAPLPLTWGALLLMAAAATAVANRAALRGMRAVEPSTM